jgi:DNA-binding response OmpR family regulator
MREHTILIVEDDLLLASIYADTFFQSGYKVLTAATGNAFKAALREHRISLIILDLNLPDANGMELLRDLRESSQMLLIVVSGSQEERDRILSLTFGADDFLTKPVTARELELRARNLLARQHQVARQQVLQPTAVSFSNGWQLDIQRQLLLDDSGKSQPLTQAEFSLLRKLASVKGAIVSRQDLFDTLAREAGVTNMETLSTLVYRLRRKLSSNSGEDVIVTLSKVGFRVNLTTSEHYPRALQA